MNEAIDFAMCVYVAVVCGAICAIVITSTVCVCYQLAKKYGPP